MKQPYQHIWEHSTNTSGKFKLQASGLVKLGQISETGSRSALIVTGVWVRRHPGWMCEGKLLKCPYSYSVWVIFSIKLQNQNIQLA